MILFLDILSMGFSLLYIFVLLKIIHTFLPLRKNIFVRLAAVLAASFLFETVVYSNDFVGLFFPLLGMCAYISLFHSGNQAKKITSVLVFYPALIAVNYLIQDIGSKVFFTISSAPPELSSGWTYEQLLLSTAIHTFCMLLRLLFWIMSWQILHKYPGEATSNLTLKMWFIIDVFMLAPFTAIFIIIYFMPENPLIVYPICGTSLFSSFGCIYLASYISDSLQTAYHVKELEMKQKHYHERIEAEEKVCSVYHDMKNHLLVLQNQTASPKTEEMLHVLQSQVAIYEDYTHTGNDILDIILKEKSALAREKQIALSVTADLNEIDFIEPLDISTLFGNGLDNALEASGQLPEEERVILVKSGKVQNFFSVLIQNNCVKERTLHGNTTTKKDRFLHGYGISNMRKAARKYNGELLTKCENGKFTLKILIPIP